MGFSQAVSGLNAAASNLDVIGNNIANSATSGFKSSSVSFADMFAGSKVGLGVKVAGVMQDFTDGTTTTTNRGLDVAISNNGFFRLQDSSGGIFYSRNGQFKLDENRNLINMQGLSVTGFPAAGSPPAIQQGAQPVPLSVPATMISAKPTSTATMVANLNSTHDIIDSTTTPFDINNANSYSYKNTITVYDSLGNAHNNNIYFIKTASNQWDIRSDDTSLPTSNQQKIGSMTFNPNGTLASTSDATGAVSDPAFTLNLPVDPVNGSAAGQTVALSFASSIQQNTSDNVGSLTQNGYTAGQLTGYQINEDGTLEGIYSNQQTQLLGQIVLSNFANPEGLASQGNNVWQATQSSGQAITGLANSGSFGTLTSGALESSNVDLSKELVNMIVAQRNYQSNAQTIKTQDQILQTLVNLR